MNLGICWNKLTKYANSLLGKWIDEKMLKWINFVILVQQDVVTFTESVIAVLLPFCLFLNWHFKVQLLFLFLFLPLVLQYKYVRYFCIFYLACRVKLHPYLRETDINWQILALEMGATARHGMWDKDEYICSYKWKILCLAKALIELNIWKRGVCACWEQRDECRLLCPPGTVSYSFLRELSSCYCNQVGAVNHSILSVI